MTTTMTWTCIPPCTIEHLGRLPSFVSPDDPSPAVEQFDRNYRFAGGWVRTLGFTLYRNGCLHYPGDPPLRPIAAALLRQERIYVYPHAFVAVVQPDGSFEVARLD